MFDAIVDGNDVTNAKPDQDFFTNVNSYKIQPENAFVLKIL
jgi:hypothetical protein